MDPVLSPTDVIGSMCLFDVAEPRKAIAQTTTFESISQNVTFF